MEEKWINKRNYAFLRGCLEYRLTRHGVPRFFRRRCGGRFERHETQLYFIHIYIVTNKLIVSNLNDSIFYY
jgi:hypothetical protein